MMISEFYQAGGPNVSVEDFEAIEDVWTAYNRFHTKGQMASFVNEHGMEGVKAMREPLNRYRSFKRGKDVIQEQIDALQKQIAVLQEKQNLLDVRMEYISLQCDLSSHWAKWA